MARFKAFLAARGPAVATLLFALLLAWLVSRWAWEIARPREIPPAPPPAAAMDANAAAERVAAAHLFGVPGAARQEAQVSTLNVRLKGVIAARGRQPAFAILNTGQAKDEPFRVGEDILPGVKLDSVQPEHVVVRRGAGLERVNLEERASGGGAAVLRPQALSAPAPGQFRVNPPQTAPGSFNVSRGEIGQALQDPRQLTNLGRVIPHAGGGVQVEDVPPGSLAERLGLQQGDVVRNVNGVPVNSPADLTRLYTQLGQAGQVRVDGLRGNRPLNLTYNITQ